MAGIKHSTTKTAGQKGYASDWNADHEINGDVDMGGFKFINEEVKTYYYSISPQNFHGTSENEAGVIYGIDGEDGIAVDGAYTPYFCSPVSLPNGAVVTKCVVYGNAGTANSSWRLDRATLASSSSSNMATAFVGTEDTTITNPTIDNSTYVYRIWVYDLVNTDVIYGARITYTL